MNRKSKFFLICMLFLSTMGLSQDKPSTQKFVDLNFGVGDTQGSFAASFRYDWSIGKKQKFHIGVGPRLTSYLGKNQYYSTAPAKLTSGGTGPGVLFKENIIENIDTFLIKSAQVNAVNLFLDLSYNFSSKFTAGFNIDVIGFSFGGKVNGNYINGFQGATVGASPTSFNLLLISDNDKGTLNSELYGCYFLNNRWGLKAGLQFLFTEYTTEREVQQEPEPNDRFRNKSLMFTAGVTFKL